MDTRQGASLLAIVVLTADDDCSLRDTSFFLGAEVDLDLHCVAHQDLLFDVKSRFYEGLHALRPGRGDDVVFAAIAGVPPDLVERDDASRDNYYAEILRDPRMQQELGATTDPELRSGGLVPSCVRQTPGESASSNAYPPRRLVQLASLFGENATVQSICQDDLGPAVNAIAEMIQGRIGAH